MKKILLGSSALLAFSTLAVAHTRDGLVAAGGDTVELAIEGSVEVYQLYRTGSASSADYTENEYVVSLNVDPVSGDTTTFGYLVDNATLGYPVVARTFTPGAAVLGLGQGYDASFDSFGQAWDADVDFIASTHWNGLEFVGNIDLNLSSEGNALDKAYIDIISEKYGTLRLGKGATVSDELMITAGTPFDSILDDDENRVAAHYGIGDTITVSTANEIAYLSPVYSGFQFGIGFEFANDNGIDAFGGNSVWTFDGKKADDDILTGSALQLAAVYENEFNAFSYGISAAARWALGDTDTDFMYGDYDQEYFVGLELGYMGFTWTNTYHYAIDEAVEDFDLYNDRVGNNYRTSLEWNWGAWTAGVGYQRSWGEDYALGLVESYNVDSEMTNARGAEYTTDHFDFGVEREIVGGVTVGASVAYVNSEIEDFAEVDGFQIKTGIEMDW